MIGHDGTSTRIEDSYGFLAIKSNALELQTYTGGEVYAKFTRNGAVELRYDNAVKLTTENTGVNITGIVTATSADINGDLDVDGHTNLDNVSIAGVTTTSRLNINSTTPIIDFLESDGNPDYRIYAESGTFVIRDQSSIANRLVINSTGVSVPNDLDVDGHTNLDNVSIAGVTTTTCLLYTSPSPRDRTRSRMPSSA